MKKLMSFKDLTHFTLALAGTQVYAASWNSMGAWAEHTRQRHKAAAKRCDFAGKIIGTQFGTYGKSEMPEVNGALKLL